jgi:hypothetical protein
MYFRRIRGVKRSVFAKNAEWNVAFWAITRYSQKSGYVLGFNTHLYKIFEILGLSLVCYWIMPKNCEKRTIKSCACVPLSICLWIPPRVEPLHTTPGWAFTTPGRAPTTPEWVSMTKWKFKLSNWKQNVLKQPCRKYLLNRIQNVCVIVDSLQFAV